MKPVEIKPDIFWVGAVDWNKRDFHGYSIDKGTTYNAYLLRDDKTVLFDTVLQEFKNDLVHHLRQVIDPEKIDYLVVNHVELDHSGCLPELVELIKPEKIICSPMGHKALLEHFHRPDWPYEVVKTGDSIDVGKRTVRFIETRMLHWPDSMFSYIPEEKLLISSDAFGQHWATSQRFDDQVDQGELMAHATKYYANILLLFSPNVEKLLAQVQADGLEIDMIAPDHGLIWRRDPVAILEAYQRWCRQEASEKAIIIYDTMWHSTEKMARAVARGLQEEGINAVTLLHARRNHRSDIMTEVLDAKAVILGSATLNNNIMPALADVLTYMKGLRPKNKVGAAFGSYGWSGEAVKHLNGRLEEMGIAMAGEGVRIKNVPNHESLAACVELGRAVARAMG